MTTRKPPQFAAGELNVYTSVRDISNVTRALRHTGRRVMLVPTMGALHDGHLALLRAAREQCDVVVMSLFVNPAQFAPGEDLEAYPRDEQRDAALASDEAALLPHHAAVGTLQAHQRSLASRGRAAVDAAGRPRRLVAGLGEEDAVSPDHRRRTALVRQLDLPADVLLRAPLQRQVFLRAVPLGGAGTARGVGTRSSPPL